MALSDEAIERRMQELRETAEAFSKAYAQKEFLEEFRKSKLALLMKDAEIKGFSAAVAQEREARAHSGYIGLLEALRTATEASEALRWKLKIAEMGVSVWQTQNANMRAERKGYVA